MGLARITVIEIVPNKSLSLSLSLSPGPPSAGSTRLALGVALTRLSEPLVSLLGHNPPLLSRPLRQGVVLTHPHPSVDCQ